MAGVELVLCPPAEAEQQRGGLEDVEQRPRGRVPEHHEARAVADYDLTNEMRALMTLRALVMLRALLILTIDALHIMTLRAPMRLTT